MSAQKARGADFETGNLFQRARALLPLLVPLFVSAFRRADELAVAMECRCYHGDEGPHAHEAAHLVHARHACHGLGARSCSPGSSCSRGSGL